jgi:hypothetical protein
MIGSLPIEWGWRACFFVSLPIAAISAWLATSVRDGSRTNSKKVDLLGAGLLAVALGSLCTFLTLGREERWPAWTWLVLAAAATSWLLFMAWQRHCRRHGLEHLVPGELLARNRFDIALLTLLIFYAASPRSTSCSPSSSGW